MRVLPLLPALLAVLLTTACSQAHSDETTTAAPLAEKPKKKKNKNAGANEQIDADVPGLRRVGSLSGVPESSGLAPGLQPGTYYSFGDNGNAPILYQINSTGAVTNEIRIGAKNKDWKA